MSKRTLIKIYCNRVTDTWNEEKYLYEKVKITLNTIISIREREREGGKIVRNFTVFTLTTITIPKIHIKDITQINKR